jgi:signal transduction histidine kinase
MAIEVDRGQISQVVVNLALNALQAMEKSDVRVLDLRAAAQDRRAVIEILDTGPGIPADKLPQVLEAFYSLRKGGTGLGLAIASRIAQAHDGSLELTNRPEGGLAARVVLPVVDRSEAV